MVTASDVLALIHEMGHTDITLETQNLVTDDLLSSIEIFNLIIMIEERFGQNINGSLLSPESLSSCASIAKLLQPAN